MKRPTIFSIAAVVLLVPLVGIVLAAPPDPIARALSIMSTLRNQTSGDNIVQLPGAKAVEWTEYFYDAYPRFRSVDGEGLDIPFASMTNDQRAVMYLNILRDYHKQVRLGTIRQAASTQSLENTANSETDIDLGTPE